MLLFTVCLVFSAAPVVMGAQQPGHEPAPEAASHGDAAAHGDAGGHGEAPHGESLLAFLSRLANFAILAGGLYYLLRTPLGTYLNTRSTQIRSELDLAAATRSEASSRLAEIERRVAALPAEIEALKARGQEEMAAEQVRIKETAEAERQRLVEQTRREIDRQLQIARRDLTEHAADLAVGVARTRLERGLTPEDQRRLVDRFVSQVGDSHE